VRFHLHVSAVGARLWPSRSSRRHGQACDDAFAASFVRHPLPLTFPPSPPLPAAGKGLGVRGCLDIRTVQEALRYNDVKRR
jgi:hypothetical protein